MNKTAYEIRLGKLSNGEISQEEFDRQERTEGRKETAKLFGVLFGGALLLCIFFNTSLGRTLDTLLCILVEYCGYLILGFVVIGGVLSVVLHIARGLKSVPQARKYHEKQSSPDPYGQGRY